MAKNDSIGNKVYLCMPFITQVHFEDTVNLFTDAGWSQRSSEDVRYLYSYVCQSAFERGFKERGWMHYTLPASKDPSKDFELFALAPDGSSPDRMNSSAKGRFINKAKVAKTLVKHYQTHCFIFGKGVGILCFEMELCQRESEPDASNSASPKPLPLSDPYEIASRLHTLHSLSASQENQLSRGNRLFKPNVIVEAKEVLKEYEPLNSGPLAILLDDPREKSASCINAGNAHVDASLMRKAIEGIIPQLKYDDLASAAKLIDVAISESQDETIRYLVGETLLEIAKKLLDDVFPKDQVEVCNPTVWRNQECNAFVYVCSEDSPSGPQEPAADTQNPSIDHHLKAIHHLANLWETGFPYDTSNELIPETIRETDMYWGVSNKALACIAYANPQNRNRYSHLSNAFRREINSDYLFMYMLLMHQKYTYQHWLCDLDSTNRSIERLEKYKRDLDTFHADYVYARVSDYPQYQVLYERTYDQLGLAEMEIDMREPVDRLAREQLQQERIKEEKRENRLNAAVNAIALLSTVSVLADGRQFTKEVCEFLGLGEGWQVAFMVALIAVLAWVLFKYFTAVRNQSAKTNRHHIDRYTR